MEIKKLGEIEKPANYEYLATPLWGKVLYPGMLIMLTAPMKAGKSSTMITLLANISRGEAWGGIKPIRPITVVYGDFELPKIIQWNKILPHKDNSPGFSLLVYNWAEEEHTNIQSMFATVAVAKPDIFVIDPMSYAFDFFDENDARAAKKVMRTCKKFCEKTGVCVIMAHHDRKPQAGMIEDPRYSARGSSVFGGAVDAQWNILLGRNRQRYLQVTFSRYGSTDEHEPVFELYYDNDTHLTTGKLKLIL